MARARLVSVDLHNFRLFRGRHHLDLPRSGVVVVRAVASEGRSTNAAGKTTLFLAVGYALGLGAGSAERLTSRGEQEMSVRLRLDLDGCPMLVERGTAGCAVELDGRRETGAAANARLRLALGDPGLLEAVSWRRQRRPGFFKSLTPAKKAEFLAGVLGLDRAAEAAEVATRAAGAAEAALLTARGALAQAEAALAQAEAAVAPPGEPPDLNGLRWRLETAQVELAQRADAARVELDRIAAEPEPVQARSPKVAVLAAIVAQMQEAERLANEAAASHNAAVNQQLAQLARVGSTLRAAATALPRLEAALAALRQSRCQTCGQAWAGAAEEEARVAEQIRQAELAGRRGAAVEAEEGRCRAQLRQLAPDPQLAAARQALDAAYAEEVMEQGAKASERAREQERRKQAVLAPLREAERATAAVADELERMERAAQVQAAQRAYAAGFAATCRASADRARAAVREHEALAAQEKDLALGLRAWQAQYLAGALADVARRVGQLTATVPNVAGWEVSFATDRTTKAGESKGGIEEVVTYGAESWAWDDLSGGQQVALELAVDEALATVVAERTGVAPAWRVLDEALNDLSVQDRETVLHFLQQTAEREETCYLVVDQSREVQEICEEQIVVRRAGEWSELVIE